MRRGEVGAAAVFFCGSGFDNPRDVTPELSKRRGARVESSPGCHGAGAGGNQPRAVRAGAPRRVSEQGKVFSFEGVGLFQAFERTFTCYRAVLTSSQTTVLLVIRQTPVVQPPLARESRTDDHLLLTRRG